MRNIGTDPHLPLTKLEHGGNLAQAAQQYGIPIEDWLDLSTGINPYHYPIPHLQPSDWQRLPSGCEGLEAAACAYYGAKAALATAGSQAALQTLPQLRSPCTIAMPKTMYQEHAHAWRMHHHTVLHFEGAPDDALLAACDVLLLCNPNNPTGERYSPAQLLTWHETMVQKGGWLIVDEAFMDPTPEDSLAHATDREGLIILRSLGKFFGLAGARVGFLLAAPKLLKLASVRLGPWAITGPSQRIAELALNDRTWQQAMRQQLKLDSTSLVELLQNAGLAPSGGTALFQYVQTAEAIALQQALAKQGIWVRRFDEPQALRFGLCQTHEYSRMADALDQLRAKS